MDLLNKWNSSKPKGFNIYEDRFGNLKISFKTEGMVGTAIFFTIWLSIWTIGCFFMALDLWNTPIDECWGLALFSIPFFAAEVGTIIFLLWYFVGKTYYILGKYDLSVSKELFFWNKRTSFDKSDINIIRQIKDGGDSDSFDSWGLALEGKKNVIILSKQKFEKSYWLGQLIADWADSTFIESEKKDYEII
ncbi:hypothetical protein [Desulfoluna spongiiphila]|uniref:hypothetical protein n=1 Tax=Desulfoluna spongiiphila TaxID=419481 RepID=UPI00125FE2D3|nr:hypothetical protein [Desulfoluna spongiiphila]